jgi:hypothetical protein
MDARAVWRVGEPDDRRAQFTDRLDVPHIGPEAAGLRVHCRLARSIGRLGAGACAMASP